jgi:hypothetical protein
MSLFSHNPPPLWIAFGLLALGAVASGCSRLPAVNAKLIRYDSSYPVGGTSITVKDVHVTDTEVRAAEYHRVTKLWGFSQSVMVEEYSRKRTPSDGDSFSP